MFSFFRSSLPSRMVFIALLAIVSLVLTIFFFNETSVNQFHLSLVSQKVASGKLLYLNIYDYLAPLPVYFNSLFELISKDNVVLSRMIAFLIILINSLYVNNIVDKYRLIEERSFIPGLMYLIFSSSIFTGFELSPFLISTIFLNLGISSLLKVGIEKSDKIKSSFHAGIYFGLAFLCNQALILFLLLGIAAMFYFSSRVLRTIIPYILGFTFPFIIMLNYYLINQDHDMLFHYFINGYFFGDEIFNLQFKVLTPWLVLTLFFVFMYFPTKLRHSFTNYKSKGHQLFVVWVFLSFLVIFMVKERSYDVLHVLVTPVTFLASFYLINLRKRWIAEFFTVLLICFVFVFNYFDTFNNNETGLMNQKQIIPEYDGKVLILANDISIYSKNEHGSAFTNWELEKKSFLNIRTEKNIATMYLGITQDYPKYIIDPDGIFSRIMELVPLFREKYKKVDSKTYRLN